MLTKIDTAFPKIHLCVDVTNVICVIPPIPHSFSELELYILLGGSVDQRLLVILTVQITLQLTDVDAHLIKLLPALPPRVYSFDYTKSFSKSASKDF